MIDGRLDTNGEDQVENMKDNETVNEGAEQGYGNDALDRSIPPELADAFAAAKDAESSGPEAGIEAWQNLWAEAPGHPEIIDALIELYGQTEKWHILADFLKKNVNDIGDEPAKLGAMMALARIYDPARADTYQKMGVEIISETQLVVDVLTREAFKKG